MIKISASFGQETKHVKRGHAKIDRAHFRVHFCEHWKFPVSTLVGVFVGTFWCVLHRKNLSLREHFRAYTPMCIFVSTFLREFMGQLNQGFFQVFFKHFSNLFQ